MKMAYLFSCLFSVLCGCSFFESPNLTKEQNAERLFLVSRETTYFALLSLDAGDRAEAIEIMDPVLDSAIVFLSGSSDIVTSDTVKGFLSKIPAKYHGLIEVAISELMLRVNLNSTDLLDADSKMYLMSFLKGVKAGVVKAKSLL